MTVIETRSEVGARLLERCDALAQISGWRSRCPGRSISEASSPRVCHRAFLAVTERFKARGIFAETVASIPGRWAMVGIAGEDPEKAMANLRELRAAIGKAGLHD